MIDREVLAEIIESAQRRGAESHEIADEILVRLEDPAWGKAMSHPTRTAILRLMRARGPLSPVGALRLGAGSSLGTVAYHFRLLHDMGFFELCDTVGRSGATEHFYRLSEPDLPRGPTSPFKRPIRRTQPRASREAARARQLLPGSA